MTAVLKKEDNASEPVLYMVLELSNKKWKVGFSDGERNRVNTIDAGDWISLNELIGRAKEKFKFPADCRVVSCYQAGRDGFWIHRALEEQGSKISWSTRRVSRSTVGSGGPRQTGWT